MPVRSPIFALALLCGVFPCGFSAKGYSAEEPKISAEDEAFFEKQVRPVLVARCFECHGASQQKGSVRLDSRAESLKTTDGGTIVVPGKPEESRLIDVIGYEDAIRMPPKEKLPDREIATLTEWVRRGAPFPASAAVVAPVPPGSPEGIARAQKEHWAYQPLSHATVPEVRQKDWVLSPIDQFILAKLEAQGIAPSPAAERRVWLRRVTFDLLGLPPTYEDVQAFEQDSSPEAYAKVVDRLLASPQYGERWARHWLDVARYADTKGYVFTEERKYPYSYTYRDYVINAFNADVPIDQFFREQLAADQLPLGENKQALAAMGFLTLGRRFGNNVNDIIDDRIDVVTRGLLGLTVGCARCHDHKYDPIPTEDYYSLYGVFSASMEPTDLPQIGPSSDQQAYAKFETELNQKTQEVEQSAKDLHAKLQEDFRSQTGKYLVAALGQKTDSFIEQAKVYIGAGDLRRRVIERWTAYLNETAKQPNPVWSPWHALVKIPNDQFEAQSKPLLEKLLAAPTKDSPERINARVQEALKAMPPKSAGDVVTLYADLLVGAHNDWKKARAENAGLTALADPVQEELRQVLYAENGPVTFSTADIVPLYDRAMKNKQRELQRNVDKLRATSPGAPPRAMVLNDAPQAGLPHVLIRGNPGRPGQQVPRRFLRVLAGTEQKFDKGSGRLELAEAIVRPTNPLTARVFVNRVWTQHFGFGLVRTPSDFGFRGDPPTHPELLDYLAQSFMDESWSLKKLHRRILLSRVYQQQSTRRPEAAAIDPENRLLWRMNPHRLEFEPMRDSLLQVAGKLDPILGGRPVDLFAEPFTTRRTVYGFIDRQDLPGLFRSFDFASPDVSTAQRSQTTIPQQALYALNAAFVIEQAKRLAARPEVTAATTPAAKVTALYRLAFAREPRSEELSLAQQFVDQASAPVTADGVWSYGYGSLESSGRVAFTRLPVFADRSWRGGPTLPDPKLDWVMLNAGGGHTGGRADLSAIRRWTAPVATTVNVRGTLANAPAEGDGVRGHIVSSRQGILGTWTIHHGRVETPLANIAIQEGETLDFVVACIGNASFDSFSWAPVLESPAGAWNAASEFTSVPTARLSPWEQLAQALFETNEFVFID